jgi:hypothetical protein
MRVRSEDAVAWEIILPIVANIIQGGLAGGMASSGAARENNRQSEIARLRRAELQPIIDRLRKARDYFGVEENLVRDFSRSADQMAAQSAQTGMTNAGSGGLDRNRADLLGSMLASLAQFKGQDEMQREQLLAQLVGDPSLYADAGGMQNVGATGLMGALAGAAGGAGSALNAFLGTQEGLNALRGLFSPAATPTPGVSTEPYTDPFFDFLAAGSTQRPSGAPTFGVRAPTAPSVPQYTYTPMPTRPAAPTVGSSPYYLTYP